jgi:hypothetical protein
MTAFSSKYTLDGSTLRMPVKPNPPVRHGQSKASAARNEGATGWRGLDYGLAAVWLVCLGVSTAAGLDLLVDTWQPNLALMQAALLLVLPLVLQVREAQVREANGSAPVTGGLLAREWPLAITQPLLAVVALGFVASFGAPLWGTPPSYHDEYSYLFEAQTMAGGSWTAPAAPAFPALFDQVHVLNEGTDSSGRMASRYYPGTALWMLPWVLLGSPLLGHWLAQVWLVLAMDLLGRELKAPRAGFLAALLLAVSPGMATFGNLLLSHHPTLAGLALFWLFISRWLRTSRPLDAFLSMVGLSFAMLCRPATAFAVGVPFTIPVLIWFVRSSPKTESATRGGKGLTLAAFALPLVVGWGVMLAYNEATTGSLGQSPYQLYTSVYTPRHVFGFENGTRGDLSTSPKVWEAYDRWADNLTLPLALQNLATRLAASFLWMFDPLFALATGLLVWFWWPGGRLWPSSISSPAADRRWYWLLAGILTLHLMHFPYWYAGIMGWHYVFETAPLLALATGLMVVALWDRWHSQERHVAQHWLLVMLVVAGLGANVSIPGLWTSRRELAYGSIEYPKVRVYQAVDDWLARSLPDEPVVVLFDQDPGEIAIDHVTNTPGWQAKIIRGRYLPQVFDATNPEAIKQLAAAFPGRSLWYANPKERILTPIRSIKP